MTTSTPVLPPGGLVSATNTLTNKQDYSATACGREMQTKGVGRAAAGGAVATQQAKGESLRNKAAKERAPADGHTAPPNPPAGGGKKEKIY